MIRLIYSKWKKRQGKERQFKKITTFDQALALDEMLKSEISRHCLDIERGIEHRKILHLRFPELGPIDFDEFDKHQEVYYVVEE